MQILRWRLGIAIVCPIQRCCNVKADGEPCEELLDAHADHAVTCGCGPLRIQRHNLYADELADCITETGAHVRREAFVAEFATQDSDAILDVWAFGRPDIGDLLVDVTIRHPMAATYQSAASEQVGHAAAKASDQKLKRYPAFGGRLGSGAEELLDHLAASAARREAMRGHASSAGSCLKRWRAALDAVVQRGVASAVLSAKYGLAGIAFKSQRWARAAAPAPAWL